MTRTKRGVRKSAGSNLWSIAARVYLDGKAAKTSDRKIALADEGAQHKVRVIPGW